MFQRLKGAIDSRIAEEQARQRSAIQPGTPSRSLSGATLRPSRGAGSPAPRQSRARERKDISTERGPDPSEFDPEFVVGDDESATPSGVNTPRRDGGDAKETGPLQPGAETPVKETKDEQDDGAVEGTEPAKALGDELPTEIRVKLRKLDRLETRYQELLRAYRVAHARVLTIEPFEASLRENTPLTSINDPGALLEYLNQITLKTDMVVEELKRVSAEKNDSKMKHAEAEKTIQELKDELEKARETRIHSSEEKDEDAEQRSVGASTDVDGKEQAESLQSPRNSLSSRVPSFTLFSPKSKPLKSPPVKVTNEDLFSYDGEIPRLESELQARQNEVEELKKQTRTLQGDLSVARESTESMVQSLESATRELHVLRDAKDKHEAEKATLQTEIDDLNDKVAAEVSKQAALHKETEELKQKSTSEDTGRSDLQQRLDSLQAEFELHETQLTEASKTIEELRSSLQDSVTAAATFKSQLEETHSTVKDLEDSLALAKSAERQEAGGKKLETLQNVMTSLRSQLKDAENDVASLKMQLQEQQKYHENHDGTKLFTALDAKFDDDAEWKEVRSQPDAAVDFLTRTSSDASKTDTANGISTPIADPEHSAASKKKNKKKKKGKGGQADPNETAASGPATVPEALAQTKDDMKDQKDSSEAGLEAQIEELQTELKAKVTTIESLSARLKDQESLSEEIETLRDDLLHQGQEHVEARDHLKKALAEKKGMQDTIDNLEKELIEHRATLSSGKDDSDKAYQDLLKDHEKLNIRITTLETDLTAARQLAAARFKDITDLRDVLSKAQPELRSLRQEVSELKSVKEDLKNKSGELRRLEARHEDLKAEMKGLGKKLGDQDSEVKSLQQKVQQETAARTKVEEELSIAHSDYRTADARRNEAVDSHSLLQKDHSKVREELQTLKTKVLELESQISDFDRSGNALKEEIALKTAQHASAESLMSSMRDQTMELSTQMREAASRAESLEEELSETQRMLSERTREGETMRRLLSDVETRAESKVREMKERLDTAIEERDRAEDEAATAGRRMAREVEDLKTKARDAQRALKRIEDDKEELEHAQRDWKRRREDLERQNEHATTELADIRKAMSQLRDALDESEKQTHDLERQKLDLRKSQEETQGRLEKLQSSNKSLVEETKTLQSRLATQTGKTTPIAASSRSSIDANHNNNPSSSPAPPYSRTSSVIGSPGPRDRRPAETTPSGPNTPTMDYVYLKNVLLQFLEQKDKTHQKQLIPVLGMLLKFDRKDEQKWMSAIAAR